MSNSRAWLSLGQLPSCYYGRLSTAGRRQWFLRKREKSLLQCKTRHVLEKAQDCIAFSRHYVGRGRSSDSRAEVCNSRMELFWINRFRDGNLAIMPAPRVVERMEDTILAWRNDGIDCVVSLLEPSEIPALDMAESELCREFGIEFLSFPIPDKSVPPSLDAFAGIVALLAGRISSGHSVAIHCRAGIGRSTTVAASVLIWLGVDAEVALDMIAEARGREVPETEAQRQWILAFPDAMRRLRG